MLTEKVAIEPQKEICRKCARTEGADSVYSSCRKVSDSYTSCQAVDPLLGNLMYVPRK